jgi:hypothetical protein
VCVAWVERVLAVEAASVRWWGACRGDERRWGGALNQAAAPPSKLRPKFATNESQRGPEGRGGG